MKTLGNKPKQDSQENTSTDRKHDKTSAKTTFQFVDNRPVSKSHQQRLELLKGGAKVKQLKALQSLVGQSSIVQKAAQRQEMVNSSKGKPVDRTIQKSMGEGVVQRAEKKMQTTGRTHLVHATAEGSIYEGEEGKYIDSQEIIVETNDRILSRRGPNQELFRKHDKFSPQQYIWIKVLQIGKENVSTQKWYVREDALSEEMHEGKE